LVLKVDSARGEEDVIDRTISLFQKLGRRPGALTGALLAAALLCGCAESRDSLREKIANLEREIMRLNAEKANAVAKSASLDDERLVLERKVEACDAKKHERSLKVVRLKPEDESGPGEQPAQPWPNEKRDDGKRPLLTLVGYPGGDPAPSPELPARAQAAVPPTYGGDNLGVVAAGTGTGAAPADGTMEQFQEAYRSYTNSRYDEALSGFARFVAANPNHEYADNALFWRGECLLAQGKGLLAVGEYERLLARYPRSEKAPAVLLRIGFVYDKLGDLGKASDYYFKVVDEYPGSDEARKASQRVAAIGGSRNRAFGVTPTSAKR
jgi:tol-pal system protein YbgF